MGTEITPTATPDEHLPSVQEEIGYVSSHDHPDPLSVLDRVTADLASASEHAKSSENLVAVSNPEPAPLDERIPGRESPESRKLDGNDRALGQSALAALRASGSIPLRRK